MSSPISWLCRPVHTSASAVLAVFEFYRIGPCDRDPATAMKLFPKASSFEAWAKKNADVLKAAWFK
jgi:hypothetical protein